MRFFIDESGTFVTKGVAGSSVSLVGAIAVPNARMNELARKWAFMRRAFPKNAKGEVKGSLLSEEKVVAVIRLLEDHEVLFEASLFDVLLGSDADIALARQVQADQLLANLTPEHHDNIWNALRDFRAQLLEMPNQLYVQFMLMTRLVRRILNHASMYYVQRRPNELASFHWVVDAKGPAGVTTGEKWWRAMLVPFLQSMSLRDPTPMLIGADYSHFKRFESQVGNYLLPFMTNPNNRTATNIKLVVTEDFRFSAEIEPGLELVDVVTNALRRALTGNLDEPAWDQIRRLMIHRNQQGIEICSFKPGSPQPDLPYEDVILAFKVGGRVMIPEPKSVKHR